MTVLYRSQIQYTDEFDLSKTKLEEIFNKINDRTPFIFIYLGDFNATNSNWGRLPIIPSKVSSSNYFCQNKFQDTLPPAYKRDILDFSRANNNAIKRSL